MERTIQFRLNKVSPTPASLRAIPEIDAPDRHTTINLAQLFLHHYWDSYPSGPPNPDPSRFEYLQLVSGAEDFRFHAYVEEASTVKRRTLSTELGQAFCRLMLHDHFGIVYFAHLSELIGKTTRAGLDGIRIDRTRPGSVPDYLCARKVSEPYIAEAKGRFCSIGFNKAEFDKWRQQFSTISVLDRQCRQRSVKGFIVGTRFTTDATGPSRRTTVFLEDPSTPGEPPGTEERTTLGRAAIVGHYARVLAKLGLESLGFALRFDYALTRQLTFQVPVWTCLNRHSKNGSMSVVTIDLPEVQARS